ncbi:TPA: prepilin-type N-terminal cleavage/methylation domain-containing protein [Aeromonas salmonicida]|uniref:SpsI n=3 Tax=Aeromonas salmonicida TaxID=645 RepID=A0A0H3YIC0_AERSA|nr:prepilin-type N-terminal cleavage/methylation domain-containing protein [Aeromonas salmonicida]ABO89530.1 S-protein secretion component I [Aeromonas salmonicida subsp. salmonicida A449]AKN20877.1 SpsI [Aeromonas salmonicida]AYO62630.1 prepilin-type N-terminal cleavage/methylation domain-containing protein [Aeromonas salmonicida subsp. salmonicida 01-B526]EHI51044.1 S-protein secretion component I [Aeromonas salmonicida subsp. salmonicida 01-B526]EKP0241138.1 prepilin-type N-terminal cleavag
MYPKNKGFTLIEVLVALTILISVITIMFRVVNESIFRVSRVERIQERVYFEENIYNSLVDINPLKLQSGIGEVGGVSYEWIAEPVSALFPIRADVMTQAGYDLQMFKITVTYKVLSNATYSFSFELIGWNEK